MNVQRLYPEHMFDQEPPADNCRTCLFVCAKSYSGIKSLLGEVGKGARCFHRIMTLKDIYYKMGEKNRTAVM